MMVAAYRLLLMGQPMLAGSSGPVRLSAVRAQALLWYLAAHPDRQFGRPHLVDLLWEDCGEAEGRNRLRTTLSRLRSELPVWPLRALGDSLGWDATAGIRLDTAEFAALRRMARASTDSGRARVILATAIALWRGPFLDGFQPSGLGMYENWLEQERQRREQEMLDALSDLLGLDEAAADWKAVMTHTQAALQVAPLQERFHQLLMLAHYQAGNRARALAQYNACERMLCRELGVRPDPKTTALRDGIATGRLALEQAVHAAPTPAAQAPVPGRAHFEPPLVGRTQELEQIRQGLARTRAGKGRVILLHGEAGIGKSRLADAVTRTEGAAGPVQRTLLVGHCYEAAAGLPYAPFVEVLTNLLPWVDLDRLPLAATWMAQVSRLVPDLALRQPGLPDPGKDDGQSEGRLYEGLARFLAALPGPLLLVIEDMQWADAATLRLLAYLARHTGLKGCGILATARAGNLSERVDRLLHELQRENLLEWQEVGALPAAAIGELVAAMTGRPDSALAERVHAETRGNPLFAVEVLRSLVAEGSLDPSMHGAPETLPIPPSVQAVVRGHVGRLPAPATDFLTAAAIFPRLAPFHLVRRVSGLTEAEALTALEALIRSGILTEETGGAGARPSIAFRHDLIRRVVAEGIVHARREALHRRAHACLEEAVGPQPTLRMAEQLAFHATAGALWEDGLRWSQAAAAAAKQVFAYTAAVPLLEQALKCLDELPPTPERQRLGIDIRLELHPVAFYSYPDRIPGWVLPAIDTAIALGDELRVARGRTAYAAVLIYQGAFRQALDLLEQTLPAARASGQEALLGPLLRLLGAALALCGEFDRTLAVLAEAIPLQDRLQYHLNQVSARAVVGGVLAFRGHLDDAETRLTELEQHCRKKGDPAAIAHALAYRAAAWHLRGNWERVAADSAEGLQLAREAAHPFHEYQAGIFRGPALAHLGDPAGGVAHQKVNIDLARKLGTGFLLGLAYASLGETYLAAGQPESACTAAITGIEAAKRGEAPYDAAVCQVVLGRAAAATGDRAAARAHLQAALPRLLALGTRPYAGRCHGALALLAKTPAEREKHREQAADLFRAMGMDWDLHQVQYRLCPIHD